MITKKEFIEIINRLKDTDETIDKINNILRNCRDTVETDFIDGSGIMVCHKDIVIDLLNKTFNGDDTLSWWIYDLNYGTKFYIGCMCYYRDGQKIEPDLSTAAKLYDFLSKERK